MEIIPVIEIIDGRCLGLNSDRLGRKPIYDAVPLDVAKQLEDSEFTKVQVVDRDGAKEGRIKNWKAVEKIAGKTKLAVNFEGGLEAEQDIEIVFECGATYAAVQNIAINDESEFLRWTHRFGAERFLIRTIVKEEKIAVGTPLEKTDSWIYDFIENYLSHGLNRIICLNATDSVASLDSSAELYKNLAEKYRDVHLIGTGGVNSLADLDLLQEAGCSAVIIGKAIYEGRIKLNELKRYR